MTIKQLLGGAAVAALLAGAAQAQVVTVDDDADTGGDVAAGGTVLAAEIVLADGNIAGDLVINLDFNDGGPVYNTLGGGDRIDFTVNLSGFEFTRVITSGDIDGDGSCAFAIQSGGGNEGTSVTFRATSTINACADDDVKITLPIAVTANNANFSWAASLVGPGTTLSSGTYDADDGAAGTQPLITQAQEFSVAITTTGLTPADLDSPDFVEFGGAAFQTHGRIRVVAAGEGVANLAGGPLGIDDVVTNANALTITLENATGIDSISLPGVTDAPSCAPTGTTCVIALTAAQLAEIQSGIRDIRVTSEEDDTAPIAAQALSAALSLTADDGFSTAGITGLSGNLAPITRDDGLNTDVPDTGAFEWVGLATGATANAFRVTGLPTNLSEPDACIEVQATRSTAPIANEGWQCVNANVVASVGDTWSATFNAAALRTALGTSAGNVDVEFRVRRSDEEGADDENNATIVFRRLLAREGIVTGTGFDN